MRKVIHINIPEPCHEDWSKMTPKDQGRYCASCNKTVLDFTTKTDEQIITSLESNGKLCGRFKNKQLNRDIVLARKDKNNYLSLAASGLFAFLASGNQDAFAQGKPFKTDTIVKPMVKGKVATSILNKKVITGTITTQADGLPLPGTSIIVKGTSRGVQTDFDGNFSIKVKLGDEIVASYVGMKSKSIIVGVKSSLFIALEEETVGEFTVIAGQVSYSRSYYGNETNEYESEKSKRIRERHQNWKARNKTARLKWKTERIEKREAIKNGEQERTAFGKFFFGIKRLFTKK